MLNDMNNIYKDKIVITTGDFNGIGAEITIKALNSLNLPTENVLIVSNNSVLDFYGNLNNKYEIIDIPLKGEIIPGKVSKEAGDFSFRALVTACQMRPRTIITAPTCKESMHLAGHTYNGQTEVLEKYLSNNNQKAEMLFISDGFDVFLLTRHCALKNIKISKEMIIDKVMRLQKFYQTKKRFALCALNPHAGEDGILGSEENEIILPAVKELKTMGIDITMPMPADTLFVDAVQNYITGKKAPYDCYIAMYHDQGLIPIKSIAGYKTVNTTIGLPVLRTSPSHGTAFDIAGKNVAKCDSMIAAINTALYLTQPTNQHQIA